MSWHETGRVGIGTDEPRQKLEVAGRIIIEQQGTDWNETTPGTAVGALHLDPVGNGAANTGNAITFGASDTGTGGTGHAGIYVRTDGTYGTKMYLATTDSYAVGSKTRIMIDANGNVGMGTTSPVGKLFVGPAWSTASGGDALYVKNSTPRSEYDPNVINTTNLGITYSGSSTNLSGPDIVGLTLYNNAGIAGEFSPMILFAGLEATPSQFKATMAAIYARSPLGTGNSGSWIDGELIFATAGAATEGVVQRMVINKEGKVGIGTTEPKHLLHLKSTISGPTGIIIENTNNAQSLDIDFYNNANAAQGRIRYNEGAGSFDFSPNVGASSPAMTMLYGGNVGIGTADPASKLTVVGSSNYGTIKITNSEAADTNKQTGICTLNYIGNSTSIMQYATNASANVVYYGSADGAFRGITQHSFYVSTGADTVVHGLGMQIKSGTVVVPGKMGIGATTLPGVPLDVTGGAGGASVRVRGDMSSGSYYYGFMHDGTKVQGTTQSNIFFAAGVVNGGTTIASWSGLRIEAPVVPADSAVTNSFGINQVSSAQKNFFNGSVGIGIDQPATKLHVVGAGTQAIFQTTASYSDIKFVNSTHTNFLNFSGATFIVYQGGGSGSNITFAVDSGGTATFKADVVAFGSPSDKRLKENIKPIESALDKIIKLQGVTFDWKEKAKDLDKEGNPIDLQQWKHDVGFIAQDVQKVIPELIRENDNGMLSMRHQGIAPILLEAIKELKAEIEELKNKPCNCNCK